MPRHAAYCTHCGHDRHIGGTCGYPVFVRVAADVPHEILDHVCRCTVVGLLPARWFNPSLAQSFPSESGDSDGR